MKISASIYANARRDLYSLVHELDRLKVDLLHVDVTADNAHRVHDDLLAIRGFSSVPFDVHLTGASVQTARDLASAVPIHSLSMQWEDYGPRALDVPQVAHRGLAVHADTDPRDLPNAVSHLDFLLLMTTVPGMSGGRFDASRFRRIRAYRRAVPGLSLRVDGGVNAEIAFILRTLGVDAVVSGSFLVNHDHLGEAIIDLRRSIATSRFTVADFMLGRDDLPVIDPERDDVTIAVERMDAYGLGFVLVERDGRLAGLISNADLRRGILRHLRAGSALTLDAMVNPTPVTISSASTTREMLDRIKSVDFPILFLPVVDDAGGIAGAVLFNELIKGES